MAQRKKPLEKTITNNIIRYLNSLPACYARKIHSSRYASGFPDIVCVKGGRTYWLEVKRPGGKPTKLQEVELGKWQEAGATVAVVHSLDEAKHVIEHGRPGYWVLCTIQ